MVIFSDSIAYAQKIFGDELQWHASSKDIFGAGLAPLAEQIFKQEHIHTTEIASEAIWSCAFVTGFAPESQYEILANFTRENPEMNGGIICLAGSGQNFKGQHQRSWVSVPGNIHLSLLLNPSRTVENFNLGFSILPAVSVIQALDDCDELRGKAAIKWVNDVLIDGAKVAGVLTRTQVMGEKVTAVTLGIGINVETRPAFVPDPVVPRADCLHTFIDRKDKCNQQIILENLLQKIALNYRLLLEGGYTDLLEFYRRRSAIVGRRVIVLSDQVDKEPEQLSQGIVERIGDNLELFLQNQQAPIIRGRVALIN